MYGYKNYKDLEEQNVIISYKGAITSDLLSSILHIMENKLAKKEEDKLVQRKIFNILVEALQNLYHHIDDFSTTTSSDYTADKEAGMFSIINENEIYKITTGNFVLNKAVPLIEKSILLVNSMNQPQLRQYYREILSADTIGEEAEVGLGFIDIARKSDYKLGYEFAPVDASISFFTLTMMVDQL